MQNITDNIDLDYIDVSSIINPSLTKIETELTEKEIISIYQDEKLYQNLREDILNCLAAGITIVDRHKKIAWINKTMECFLGLNKENVIGNELSVLLLNSEFSIVENPLEIITKINEANISGSDTDGILCHILPGEKRIERWIECKSKPITYSIYAGGRLYQCYDVTKSKLENMALTKKENRLRGLFNNSISGFAHNIIICDKNGEPVDCKILEVNRAFEEIIGYKSASIIGKTASEVAPDIIESGLIQRFGEVALFGVPQKLVYYYETIDKTLEIAVFSPQFGEFAAIFNDITNLKRAEDKHDKLREQFIQSQKMEAIGRLASGVVHDFNNLLTVISGNSEIAKMSLSSDSPLYREIDEILKAVKRASDLTRQLLAFSRKQEMLIQDVDLNHIVMNVNKMLRRIIGEDIELEMIRTPNLSKVRLDPGQIEQVIVNLAVNARDAMPKGGKLKIETADVELDEDFVLSSEGEAPGKYSMLSIGDTGVGMSEEVLNKMFEPFFTTKDIGKGTGLGLSTVYGIVKQSEGLIKVESKINIGTTFKLYFPSIPSVSSEETTEDIDPEQLPAGNETVLVVEDEEAVREMAVRILKQLGYDVYQARTGKDAQSVCDEIKKPFDLLISDIVMPDINGMKLSEIIQQKLPEIKTLFMSGYIANSEVQQKIIDNGKPYLQKPFKPIDLAAKVRETIDGHVTI
jgi:signal transduction histidine kinase/ActR/RegA family two-component response regulator